MVFRMGQGFLGINDGYFADSTEFVEEGGHERARTSRPALSAGVREGTREDARRHASVPTAALRRARAIQLARDGVTGYYGTEVSREVRGEAER